MRRVEGFWGAGSGECDDRFVVLGDIRQWKKSNSISTISTDGIRSLLLGVVQSKLFICVSHVGYQGPGVWNNVGCNW